MSEDIIINKYRVSVPKTMTCTPLSPHCLKNMASLWSCLQSALTGGVFPFAPVNDLAQQALLSSRIKSLDWNLKLYFICLSVCEWEGWQRKQSRRKPPPPFHFQSCSSDLSAPKYDVKWSDKKIALNCSTVKRDRGERGFENKAVTNDRHGLVVEEKKQKGMALEIIVRWIIMFKVAVDNRRFDREQLSQCYKYRRFKIEHSFVFQ